VDGDEIQDGVSRLASHQACRIEIAIDSSGSPIIMPNSHHEGERISMATPRTQSRELLKSIAQGYIEQNARTKRVKEGSDGTGIQTMHTPKCLDHTKSGGGVNSQFVRRTSHRNEHRSTEGFGVCISVGPLDPGSKCSLKFHLGSRVGAGSTIPSAMIVESKSPSLPFEDPSELKLRPGLGRTRCRP
jgi:hypothetical protein